MAVRIHDLRPKILRLGSIKYAHILCSCNKSLCSRFERLNLGCLALFRFVNSAPQLLLHFHQRLSERRRSALAIYSGVGVCIGTLGAGVGIGAVGIGALGVGAACGCTLVTLLLLVPLVPLVLLVPAIAVSASLGVYSLSESMSVRPSWPFDRYDRGLESEASSALSSASSASSKERMSIRAVPDVRSVAIFLFARTFLRRSPFSFPFSFLSVQKGARKILSGKKNDN